MADEMKRVRGEVERARKELERINMEIRPGQSRGHVRGADMGDQIVLLLSRGLDVTINVRREPPSMHPKMTVTRDAGLTKPGDES